MCDLCVCVSVSVCVRVSVCMCPLFQCVCLSVLELRCLSASVCVFVSLCVALVCVSVCEGRCYCVSQFVVCRYAYESAYVYARADAARATMRRAFARLNLVFE